MGVSTTADESLDGADDHMRQAVMLMSKCVVDECWGHDEYTPEYRAKVREVMFDLIALREKLGR